MDTSFITPSVFSPTNDALLNYNHTTALLSCEESSPVYGDVANYLKKRHFMKSPVIIYNHCHVKGVVQSAFLLRQHLELQAVEQKALTGIYIRPIVLFVLKRQTADEESALRNLKQEFVEAGISDDEIKIKTNTVDELSGMDLQDEECNVRYIIIAADLEEQWRCPFAYVVASLEERSVTTNLVNMLNCILPLPEEMQTKNKGLNTAYIITAATKFEKILDPIKNHLDDLGVDPEKIIALNRMVELLRGMSIWEVLARTNSEVKGVKLGKITNNNGSILS